MSNAPSSGWFGGKSAVMTATLEGVPKKIKSESSPEQWASITIECEGGLNKPVP
jgi:hypothetical protein